MKTLVKYTLFAVLATLVNLATQFVVLRFYGTEYALYVAMAMGTLAGLLVKYILDKKYIFSFAVKSLKEDSGRFLLYSFMGVFTTLLFWGTELLFNTLSTIALAKYVGGAAGLTAGYIVKYMLDKRFVFAG